MLEVGWSEILVIALVLIIVVGPKDLPQMLRTFGRMASRLRGMANEFKGQFDQALREAELDDVRKGLSDVNPANSLRDAMNPIRQLGQDIKADLKKASDMSTPAAPVTGEDKPAETEDEATASEPSILPDLPPVIQAAVAPVVPPVVEKASEPAPVVQPAAKPVTQAVVQETVDVPKPKPGKAAALDAASETTAAPAPAEPKTRKAPVKTKDAAVAAVASEAAVKKPASRRKSVVVESTPDMASADDGKPNKPAPRKKAEKTGDA
jgi:sec-independent protein translocase protein TatB